MGKKSKILRIKEMKIICANKVSLELHYDINQNGICQYEGRYVTLDFFQKARSVTVLRFGFFSQDSRIRVKSDRNVGVSKSQGLFGFHK